MQEVKKITVGSCFSGIGGLELGLEWTGGFETKWQIENDPYATKVLEKHWPNVQRFSDIRDVVRPPAVDLICGGFPCQDVSLAGKRSGLSGKRTTLWGQMYRLICEVEPRWVLAENVPGLLSSDAGQFFGNILRDLAKQGYDVEWGMLSAASVGAPHLRQRIFILDNAMFARGWGDTRQEETEDVARKVAHPKSTGQISRRTGISKETTYTESFERGSLQKEELAIPESGGLSERITKTSIQQYAQCGSVSRGTNNGEWWDIEPDVGRVAHGIPSRVDRIKCLGNAVVPQVAQKVGEMILRAEGW